MGSLRDPHPRSGLLPRNPPRTDRISDPGYPPGTDPSHRAALPSDGQHQLAALGLAFPDLTHPTPLRLVRPCEPDLLGRLPALPHRNRTFDRLFETTKPLDAPLRIARPGNDSALFKHRPRLPRHPAPRSDRIACKPTEKPLALPQPVGLLLDRPGCDHEPCEPSRHDRTGALGAPSCDLPSHLVAGLLAPDLSILDRSNRPVLPRLPMRIERRRLETMAPLVRPSRSLHCGTGLHRTCMPWTDLPTASLVRIDARLLPANRYGRCAGLAVRLGDRPLVHERLLRTPCRDSPRCPGSCLVPLPRSLPQALRRSDDSPVLMAPDHPVPNTPAGRHDDAPGDPKPRSMHR